MSRLIDFLIAFPMACLGAMLLVAVIFIRPQEFIEPLQGIPLFNMVFAFAAAGALLEVGLGKIRGLWSPQFPILALWVLWSFPTTMHRIGTSLGFSEVLVNVVFQTLFMLIVMFGAQSYGRLKAMTTSILVLAVFLSVIMVHQSRCEFQCIVLAQDDNGEIDFSTGHTDGRLCDTSVDCERRSPDPKAVYDCERAGLFDSFTTGRGRVRWRGKLSDPNELSLLVAASLAFAFALHASSGKSKLKNLAMAIVTGLIVYTVILSKSRGGILIMLAVFGVQFVRRYGGKGLVVGAVLGAPLLLFGGRSGSEAEESAQERIQLLYAGIDMVKQFPIMGVGVEQYKEYAWPPLTAHNSYLLPAAELGIVGQFLWYALLYVSGKIPLKVALAPPPGMDPRLHPYAIALATAYAGMLVGIFFLSMCYHPLVYIVFGLCGALYGAVRAGAPDFRVGVRIKELVYVFLGCLAFLAVMYVYTRIKGGG